MSRAHYRLDHIHGLRGAAALMVIVQHSLEVVQKAGVESYRPLLESVNLGRFGVILFFLISGLVIPYSFRGAKPLRHFALSRVLRLYPAYWVSVPVLAGVGWLSGRETAWPALIANLTMAQEFIGFRNVSAVYWTLTLELAFYLACAALFAMRGLYNPRLTSLIVVALLALAVVPRLAAAQGFDLAGWPPVLPMLLVGTRPFCVAVFFVGLLIRQAMVEGDPAAQRCACAIVPLVLAAGLVVGGVFPPGFTTRSPFFSTLALTTSMTLPVLVFMLVLWLKPKPWRPFMYLGTVSYSLYLFQEVGLTVLPYALSPRAWPLLYPCAVVVLTLAIAAAVYHAVEKPAIELGRRLTGRGASAARPTSASAASVV